MVITRLCAEKVSARTLLSQVTQGASHNYVLSESWLSPRLRTPVFLREREHARSTSDMDNSTSGHLNCDLGIMRDLQNDCSKAHVIVSAVDSIAAAMRVTVHPVAIVMVCVDTIAAAMSVIVNAVDLVMLCLDTIAAAMRLIVLAVVGVRVMLCADIIAAMLVRVIAALLAEIVPWWSWPSADSHQALPSISISYA